MREEELRIGASITVVNGGAEIISGITPVVDKSILTASRNPGGSAEFEMRWDSLANPRPRRRMGAWGGNGDHEFAAALNFLRAGPPVWHQFGAVCRVSPPLGAPSR